MGDVGGCIACATSDICSLGASYVDKYVVAREQREIQLEQTVEKKLEERYENRLKALSDQVEQLRKATEKPVHGSASAGKQ